MTDEERERLKAAAREYAVRSREEQGLPPTVEDPVALRRIAELMGLNR